MTLADRKIELRRELRNQRKAITPQRRRAAARALVIHFHRQRLLRGARKVAAYWQMGSELDVRPLLAALLRRGVAVYLPKVVVGSGRVLRFHRVEPRSLRRAGGALLEALSYRLRTVPARGSTALRACGPRLPLRRMDAVLLPLLGFDAAGTRLGQGGGYYDRALATLPAHRPSKIGVAYAAQERDELPRNVWDVPLHAVLTERGMQRFR